MAKTNQRPSTAASIQKHHLDRRAAAIAEQGAGNPDELLSTAETADWLGVSHQWLEIGRLKKYGPKFVRVSARMIRYRRGDVSAWLKSRTHSSTSEYREAATA